MQIVSIGSMATIFGIKIRCYFLQLTYYSICSSLPPRLICGMSRDKDIAQCVAELATVTSPDQTFFVQAQYWRACTVLELAEIFSIQTRGTKLLPSAIEHKGRR